ncbi:hypothetical protein ACJRO7_017629 [Eucalyptus globulus]|uniref:PGG domain-containing protein n=1 Tax=Eucalyptus globulus TaxID=34317 RepID=A0ABD3KQT1_EUCGL
MAKSPAKKGEREAGESQLRQAIANDDVAELHDLIVKEQALLDCVSKHHFPDTPLHLAAKAGKTQVAMEIAILKPPMHLALQHEQYHIVRALMTLDPKLIRVRARSGITPLHYVAKKKGDDELELLAEFLCACKSSIEDLTSQCETAVHIAIKNRNLEAFKVLFRWLKRVHLMDILNKEDQDGNTVYAIASTIEPQPDQFHDCLTNVMIMKYQELKIFDVRNIQREEISMGSLKDIIKLLSGNRIILWIAKMSSRLPWVARPYSLSQLLSMEPTIFEKFKTWFGLQDESARNIILGVATLIATATYQAALSPPGGYWQDNSSNSRANSTVVTANSSSIVEKPHKAGDIILSGSKLHVFTALNGLVFLVSIITIWITAIPLLPHSHPVYLLIMFLSSAYYFTATISYPKSDAAAGFIESAFSMSLVGLVLVVSMILWLIYCTYKIRLQREAARRRVCECYLLLSTILAYTYHLCFYF